MAKSADPDQKSRSAASDLGSVCLLRLVCPNTSKYSMLFYVILVPDDVSSNYKWQTVQIAFFSV